MSLSVVDRVYISKTCTVAHIEERSKVDVSNCVVSMV